MWKNIVYSFMQPNAACNTTIIKKKSVRTLRARLNAPDLHPRRSFPASDSSIHVVRAPPANCTFVQAGKTQVMYSIIKPSAEEKEKQTRNSSPESFALILSPAGRVLALAAPGLRSTFGCLQLRRWLLTQDSCSFRFLATAYFHAQVGPR